MIILAFIQITCLGFTMRSCLTSTPYYRSPLGTCWLCICHMLKSRH